MNASPHSVTERARTDPRGADEVDESHVCPRPRDIDPCSGPAAAGCRRPGDAWAAGATPAGQGPAHLLQLCARRHLLREQHGLDAVEQALEPADELRLRDPELGVGRRDCPRRTAAPSSAAPRRARGRGPSRARSSDRSWISARRARPASSSGALRTSSRSCLIMLPIRMTLAGCSISPAGLRVGVRVAGHGHAVGRHHDDAVLLPPVRLVGSSAGPCGPGTAAESWGHVIPPWCPGGPTRARRSGPVLHRSTTRRADDPPLGGWFAHVR